MSIFATDGSSGESEITLALATLRGFMEDMRHWEQRSRAMTELCIAGKMTYEEASRIASEDYSEVFRKWCSSTKGSPRDNMCYSVPPDYDPNAESIVRVIRKVPDVMEVETQQNYGHRKRHLYRLIYENGQWRVCDKSIILDNGRLLNTYL